MTLSQRIHKIQSVLETADESLLARIELLIESDRRGSEEVEQLPEITQKLITQSLQESKEGKVRSHDDVMADVGTKYGVPKS